MTVEAKNRIKNNIPTVFTVANFIIVLTLSYNIGATQKEIEKNVEANKNNFERHEFDTTLHMPFEDKIEIFVPRVELDSRLQNIEKVLDRIEKKIEK